MNGDISINETQLKILKAILENDKIIDDEKVGVTGYSLSKGDPKIPIGTWNDNYPQLEEKLLITRTNKDAETNGRKNKNYSITPIGIFQTCNGYERMPEEYLMKVFKCFFIHYHRGNPDNDKTITKKTMDSIFNILCNMNLLEKIHDSFYEVVESLKIKPFGDSTYIDLTYTLPTTGLHISIQKIQCITPTTANIMIDDIEDKTSLIRTDMIDGATLHHHISKFFLQAFVHHVYKIIEFEMRSFKKMGTQAQYSTNVQNSFKQAASNEKMVLDSFPPELLKIVKTFQKNLEKEIKLSLQKFKKV